MCSQELFDGGEIDCFTLWKKLSRSFASQSVTMTPIPTSFPAIKRP